MFSIQKLKQRRAALNKPLSMTSDQKERWLPCLNIELISSEESDEHDEHDKKQFVTRPLPWKSDKVNKFFQQMDSKHEKGTTQRSWMMSFK